MHLSAIVAMTPDRVIGRNGSLPWHLPEDLKFFKRTTTGHPVVMGRATYESIGRPLPKRRNIVLTRDSDWSSPGTEVIHSAEELATLGIEGSAYIIGGAQIYDLFLDRLDELIVSHVFEHYPGDTQFPEFEHLFEAPRVIEQHPHFEILRYVAKPSLENTA